MDDFVGEYKVIDRKPWFVNIMKRRELTQMHAFAIGVIRSIIDDCYTTPDKKVLEISGTLSDMDQVWNDESIPDGYLGEKKSSAPTESNEDISHLDCTIDFASMIK